MSDRYLEGRVAMVTGGASGMGRAMALEFAKAGASVAIGSLLSNKKETKADGELVNMPGMEEMERTKGELEAFGVKALAVELDVTSTESCENFYNETIKAFGKVDILANAAGITAEHGIVDHPEGLWLKVMDVNANGPFRMSKLALPGMIERKWGRIITISSTAGNVGAPMSPAYCASKAAVLGMTRAMSLEGAEHGVTANAICPGWVETTFGREWISDIAEKQMHMKGDELIAQEASNNPQKRLIQPKEIGALAAYLCRDEAYGINGQDITVSGGSLW
ncbi:MAG TPA: SDR family oxidoreductase [Sediminispirochaeta sp.]|nr:SDR family oxidoreductase [Sediminispirochaeta sp.]